VRYNIPNIRILQTGRRRKEKATERYFVFQLKHAEHSRPSPTRESADDFFGAKNAEGRSYQAPFRLGRGFQRSLGQSIANYLNRSWSSRFFIAPSYAASVGSLEEARRCSADLIWSYGSLPGTEPRKKKCLRVRVHLESVLC